MRIEVAVEVEYGDCGDAVRGVLERVTAKGRVLEDLSWEETDLYRIDARSGLHIIDDGRFEFQRIMSE